MKDQVESSFPSFSKILSSFQGKGNLFFVGGAVRDYFRDPIHFDPLRSDVDILVETSLTYPLFLSFLRTNGFEVILPNPQYHEAILQGILSTIPDDSNLAAIKTLTIKVRIDKKVFDFVIARKETDESYDDNCRPLFCVPGTLKEDLSRRDFRMNAIAIDCLTGQIIDPHMGRIDIKHQFISTVGRPLDRFMADPRRIIRFIRFLVTMSLEPAQEILTCLKEFDSRLAQRYRARVEIDQSLQELTKAFKGDTLKTIQTLHEFVGPNLLQEIFADGKIYLRPTK